MKGENQKYEKVRDLLRRSEPGLNGGADLEERIYRAVQKSVKEKQTLPDILGFLFGWVYIGWVRRSLVTISAVLVLFFIYQQAVILKELNHISGRTIIIEGGSKTVNTGELEKRLIMYKLSGKKPGDEDLDISRQQMNDLIESVNELKDKYRDLINIINSDPELRKYVEKQLNKKEKSKTNL
ncbi:MAG TPA: hypothetical protein VJ963_13730 [Bacteroidales bacterium]|nr:hypothetical protein [Bacteroidales bacterium]